MSDAEHQPTRSGRLISLIHRLIDYGKQLAATLRNPSPGTDLERLVRPFGTRDIAFILARITRGLQLAGALATRVADTAAHLDAPQAAQAATAAAPPPQRAPAALRPDRNPPPPADPRLAQMPTPEQIAAQVRRHPIGAILADICHDLGIMPRDPLWNAISDAVIEFGGNYAAMLGKMLNQALAIMKDKRPRLTPVMSPAASSTGPPRHAAA